VTPGQRLFRQEQIAELLREADGTPVRLMVGDMPVLGTMHLEGGRVSVRASRRVDGRRSPSAVELQFHAAGQGCSGHCTVLSRPTDTTWLLDRPTLLRVSAARGQERVAAAARLIVRHYGKPTSFAVDDLSEGGLSVACTAPAKDRVFREDREIKALLKTDRGQLQVRLHVRTRRQDNGRWHIGLAFARPDGATKHALRALIAQARQAA